MGFLLILTILLAPTSLYINKQLIPNDMYDPPPPTPTIHCDYCDEVFYSQSELDEHIALLHTFQCGYCDEIFFIQEELDAHIAVEHNFRCEFCSDEFYTFDELANHILSNHTYTCSICSVELHSIEAREAHIITEHGRFAYEADVVTDYLTNLQWRVGPDCGTDWNEANGWVDGLEGNWRMPTRAELHELYLAGVRDGDWGYFQNIDAWVWSGEPRGTSSAWYFDFNLGQSDWLYRDGGAEGWGFRNFDDDLRAFAIRAL